MGMHAPNHRGGNSPQGVTFPALSLADAERIFQAHAMPAEKKLYPGGIDEMCDRAFAIAANQQILGVATVRDARSYFEKLQPQLGNMQREALLAAVSRVGIYEPSALQALPEWGLRNVFKQLVWVAYGGQRGWKGQIFGSELFGRFVLPQHRNCGLGIQLLDHVLDALARENKLPLRTIPTSKKDRTYAGRADGRQMIVLNHEYFRRALQAPT